MKKLSVLAISAMVMAGAMFVSCDSGKSVKLNATIDSVSYIIGASYGQGLRMQVKNDPREPAINLDALSKGFANAAKGDTIWLGLDMEAARAFVENYYGKIQEEETARMEAEATRFLAENGTKTGVTTTPSGLQYQVIKEGTGPKPKVEDVVKVHYQGSFTNGEVFQSSFESGEPIELPVSGVISGLTEGLQLMPVGSRYIFWIPMELGYYNMSDFQLGNKPLIFEIELLEIVAN